MIEVFVPGALRNPLNGSFSRAHWSARSKWARAWKERTMLVLRQSEILYPKAYETMRVRAPKRITFTAQTGATWDDDAIPAGIKPIRDALIGYVIHSDAPDSGHLFEYAQRIDRTHRGVKITITPRTP
jgi:hypothetical protein